MKTILITGSTDGIGKLTAIKLAEDGHHIIVHGRNADKLKDTISEIKAKAKNEKVSGFVSDFSDFDSIKKMIEEISNEFASIDVLINNAGVFNSQKEKNKDGLDMRFAVNYFAPYILTNGLLPVIKNGISPRIISLSSAAQSSVNFEALAGNKQVSTQEAYAQSKLALTIWSFAFARANPEIVTIAVNPGSLLNTKMVQEAYGQHWSSADKGAIILYELATSKKYEDANGKYFDNDKVTFNNAHSDAYHQEKISELILKTDSILNQ